MTRVNDEFEGSEKNRHNSYHVPPLFCTNPSNGACHSAGCFWNYCSGTLSLSEVTATHSRTAHLYIISTGAQSSNKLQWFDLKIGHHDSSFRSGHQSSIPNYCLVTHGRNSSTNPTLGYFNLPDLTWATIRVTRSSGSYILYPTF